MNGDRGEFLSFLRKRVEAIKEGYGLDGPEGYRGLLQESLDGVTDPETRKRIEDEILSVDSSLTESRALEKILSYIKLSPDQSAEPGKEKGIQKAMSADIMLPKAKAGTDVFVYPADAISRYMRVVDPSKTEEACTHIIQKHVDDGKLKKYQSEGGICFGEEEFSRFLDIERMEESIERKKGNNGGHISINSAASLLKVKTYDVKNLLHERKIRKTKSGKIDASSLQKYVHDNLHQAPLETNS
jgi:predicted HTH domain antitoxin